MKPVKAIFRSLLTVLFLAFTVGVPMHKHYCGTELFSAGIVEKDCCCENTPTKPDDCCKSESSLFNIDQDYEKAAPQKIKLEAPKLIFYPSVPVPEVSITESPEDSVIEKEDVPLGKVPLYKLLQEFKIYG